MQPAKNARFPYTSKLTRNGQVTLPAAIRRRLGLKPGDKVAFVQDGEQVTMQPALSIAERTAGSLAQYRKTPVPTPQEERNRFAQAVADEVAQGVRRSPVRS